MRPKLSVIVLMPSAAEKRGACVASLEECPPPVPFELITAPDLPDGARRAAGEWLLVLDPAVRLLPGWFEPLAETLEQAGIAAVQPRVVGSDGRLVDAGGLVGPDGGLAVYGRGHEFPGAPGFSCGRVVDVAFTSCLLVRADALSQVSGGTGDYRTRHYTDADLSFALQAGGWSLRYEPRSQVVMTAPPADVPDHPSDRAAFVRRWSVALSTLPAESDGDDARAHRPRPGCGEPRSILFVDPTSEDPASGVAMALRLRELGHFVACWSPRAARTMALAADLARHGIPCYGPGAGEPTDPPAAARWRRARATLLSSLLVRFQFDTAVVVAENLEALDVLEAFSTETTVVVDRPPSSGSGIGWRSAARCPDRLIGPPGIPDKLHRRFPATQFLAPPGAGAEWDDDALLQAVAPVVVPGPRLVRPGRSALRSGFVTVVVRSSGRLEALRTTLESVRSHTAAPHEIIVIDETGSEHIRNYACRQPRCSVIGGDGLRFAAAANLALDAAQGEFVVLIDEGIKLGRRWVDGLVAPFTDEGVAGCGPVVAGGSTVPTGAEFGRRAEDWRRERRGQTSLREFLDPSCVVIRHHTLRVAGAFDESFLSGYFATIDLIARIRSLGSTLAVAEEVLVRRPSDEQVPVYGLAARDAARFRRYHGDDAATTDGPLLSACLIVKDEEERLPGCLLSLRGLVDEVVVMDTGSADATRNLARSAGCRLRETPWRDDFSAARNACLDEAAGVWILGIDADERASCADVSALRRGLSGESDWVFVPVISELGEVDGEKTIEHESPRIFRRLKFRYEGKIHEHLVPTGADELVAEWCRSVVVHHDGYREKVLAERGKLARNERIARASYDDDDRAPWVRAYHAARSMPAPEERVRLFREALELMPAEEERFRLDALCALAQAQLEAGHPADARVSIGAASDLVPRNSLVRCLEATALNRLGRPAEALVVVEELIADEESPDDEVGLVKVSAVRQFDAPLQMAVAYVGLGDLTAARAVLLRTIESDPRMFPGWRFAIETLRIADPEGWFDDVGRLGRLTPKSVLKAGSALAPAERLRLIEVLATDTQHFSPGAAAYAALEAMAGLDDDARGEAWNRWSTRLVPLSGEAKVVIARRLEQVAPSQALLVWEHLGNAPGAALGRSRCHTALGQVVEAVEALDGADPSTMTTADSLFVVSLAMNVGDTETAGEILCSIRPRPEEGVTAEVLLEVAAMIGPETVLRVRQQLAGDGLPGSVTATSTAG